MKCLTICLLIPLSLLPAWSQRSSYQPAAKQPTKQGDGLVDFALKQVNSQNEDYGCQIDNSRKLLVAETIKSVTAWAVLVALSFLILSFCLLLHQHRERRRREIIAAGLLAQYHNALADARSQAGEAILRFNELVHRTNTAADTAQRQVSQPPEQMKTSPWAPNPVEDVRPRPAPAAQPKPSSKGDENGSRRTEAAPQKTEGPVDLIAQISTLQKQLQDSHEREKNLQKELMKMQRRSEAAEPKDAKLVS